MQIADIFTENDGDKLETVVEMRMSGAEVAPYIDACYAKLAKRDIAGFRPGKAPREVLDRSAGGRDKVLAQVADDIVNAEGFAGIDMADVVFLDEPSFNVTSLPDAEKGFSLSASGAVAPTGTLSSAEPVAIEMPPEHVTDAEVDARIEDLRSYYYVYEDIADAAHTLREGDFALLTMTVKRDGLVMNKIEDTQRMVELGAGTMPQSFDAHLIGAHAGDALGFDFEIEDEDAGAGGFGDGGAGGESASAAAAAGTGAEAGAQLVTLHADVRIDKIRRRLVPDLDAEFAGRFGAADVEDLRRQVKTEIGMEKAKELPVLKEQRCLAALVARLEGEVPAYFADHMRAGVQFEFMQSLQEQKTNLQDFILNNNIDGDRLKESFAEEALNRARLDMALSALWEARGFELSEADIDAQLSPGEADPGEVRANWAAAHRMAELRRMCRQNKATDWLVETAQVAVVEGDGEDAA